MFIVCLYGQDLEMGGFVQSGRLGNGIQALTNA